MTCEEVERSFLSVNKKKEIKKSKTGTHFGLTFDNWKNRTVILRKNVFLFESLLVASCSTSCYNLCGPVFDVV